MRRSFWGAALVAAGTLLATGCGNGSEAEAGITEEGQAAAAVEPVSRSASREVTVAEGTSLKVRTTNTLSTKSVHSGESFYATLAEPWTVNGQTLAPAGAPVEGLIVNADEGGRVKGTASIAVKLTGLQIHGSNVAISTGTYTRNAPATKKDDATKVGIGAGIGAAIGAIAGGGKGAAIGAASGAGAGTGVVLATHGKPAEIAAESLITFQLTAPLTVEVSN